MSFLSGVKTLFLFKPSEVVGKEMIDRASRLRQDAYQGDVEYRHETYQEAIERLGLDREKIERRRRELVIQSRAWYALSLASLLYSLYLGIQGSIIGVLGALCIGLLIAFVSGFVLAFRVHQIDREELFSFQDFLKCSDGWLK